MDAVSQLKEDHRKVEALFAKFDATGERAFKGKAEIVAKIIFELKVHAEIEEKIFYPSFREKGNDLPLVLEAYEEHTVVKFLIAELESMSSDNERYTAVVTVLKEMIEHHVKEEEATMFPEARKAMGEEDLKIVGRRMEEARPGVMAKVEASTPRMAVPAR